MGGFSHLCDETEQLSNNFVEIVLKENMWILFNCVICQQNSKRNTVKTKCSHYYCSDCLSRFIWNGQSTKLPCPICKDTISYNEIEASDWMFKMQLFNSMANCQNCKIYDRYANLLDHKCSGYQIYSLNESPTCESDKGNEQPETPINESDKENKPYETPINLVTPKKGLQDSLKRNINSPLDKNELKVLTHLTRRHEENGVLRCPTRGQSIPYARIAKSRKKSKFASGQIVKKRSRIVTNIRHIVSGGGQTSHQIQQGTELKARTRQEQKAVLASVGITSNVHISSKSVLALKTTVGLNTNQMRRTRTFMKSVGVRFQNEHHERTLKENMIVSSNLQAEMVSFEEKNTLLEGNVETVECPMVYVKNIYGFAHKRLDDLDKSGQLHWRNATIPPDEILLKLGADHDGGSFKVFKE